MRPGSVELTFSLLRHHITLSTMSSPPFFQCFGVKNPVAIGMLLLSLIRQWFFVCEAFTSTANLSNPSRKMTRVTQFQLKVLMDPSYTTNEAWMQHAYNLPEEPQQQDEEIIGQEQDQFLQSPLVDNPLNLVEELPPNEPDSMPSHQMPSAQKDDSYAYPTNEAWKQRAYNLPDGQRSPQPVSNEFVSDPADHHLHDPQEYQPPMADASWTPGARGTLRPPEPLYSMPIGSSIRAFRKNSKDENSNSDFQVVKVCQDPPIFVLRNLLSPEDCQRIQQEATNLSMGPAETVTKGDFQSRKHCTVAWIQEMESDPPLVLPLARGLAHLFVSEDIRKDPCSGIEDLQVLHYEEGGEYVLHHDSETRALTIIYYLNGNAGTWFPLAGSKLPRPLHKVQAMRQCQSLYPEQHGICVGGERLPINAGDAVAFYNYLDDGSGMLNWRAIHTGLPAKGSKWIANHWFRSGGLERGY